MLFIQISHLLLVLWPFPSRFPSCLLSGVLQPLSLTGKELCPCWCGSLLQPGVGCEPQIHEHCAFLCTGFVISLIFVLCHPSSHPFSLCRWKMIFLQRWCLLSWSLPVLFYPQQVNKTKHWSPQWELCCCGLGSSSPLPGVFTSSSLHPPRAQRLLLPGCIPQAWAAK